MPLWVRPSRTRWPLFYARTGNQVAATELTANHAPGRGVSKAGDMDALRLTVYACSNRACELEMRPPDGYERQKNVETIPSSISVQDTSRRTDSSVASREGEGMTHDRASVPAASRQACKFDVSARTCCRNPACEAEGRAA